MKMSMVIRCHCLSPAEEKINCKTAIRMRTSTQFSEISANMISLFWVQLAN